MSDTPSILTLALDSLHPWISTHFPFIEHLFNKSIDFAPEVSITSPSDPRSFTSLPSLLALLSQGFYPKNIIGKSYDVFSLSPKGPINDYLHHLQGSRILFLCRDLDNSRKIFSTKTQWYYLPVLCQKVISSPGLTPSPFHKNWVELEFDLPSLKTMDPLPWLIGLLYEFSFPCNVLTSPTLCKSHVSKVEVYVEVDRLLCHGTVRVFFPYGDKVAEGLSALKVVCIKEVLEDSPIFHPLVSNVAMSSKDSLLDIEAACDEAIKSNNERQRRFVEQRKNSMRCLSTQDLMRPPDATTLTENRLFFTSFSFLFLTLVLSYSFISFHFLFCNPFTCP